MRKSYKLGLLVALCLTTALAFAGESEQSPPAATLVSVAVQPAMAAALPETPAKPAAKPAPPAKKPLGITFGFYERVRNDNYNHFNVAPASANTENSYVKFKTLMNMGVDFGPNVFGFVELGNESWKRYRVTLPGKTATVDTPFNSYEIWFNQAYLTFRKVPIKNMSLQVGRFNLVKGDALIFVSGTPGPGPRSYYYNGFDLAYSRGLRKFELIGTYTPKTDEYFPVINGVGTPPKYVTGFGPNAPANLNEWNEGGLSLYYTDRTHKSTDVDAYYVFKREYGMGRFTYSPQIGPQPGGINNYQWQPDRHLSVFGGRAVHRWPQHVVSHNEAAYQYGTQPAQLGFAEKDIRAWASYNYVTKYFQIKTKPYIRAVASFLSGSDPKNLKVDGNWDVVFGRWPQDPPFPAEEGYDGPVNSTGYVFPVAKEIGQQPSYMTNQKLVGAEAGFTPFRRNAKRITLKAVYQHNNAMNPFVANPVHYSAPGVFAPGTGGLTAGSLPWASTTGLGRFQMVKGVAQWWINKDLRGYFALEKVYFGDFYTPANRSNAYYFRSQLEYNFNHFIPFKKAPKA